VFSSSSLPIVSILVIGYLLFALEFL
jgi:hypothetical protein